MSVASHVNLGMCSSDCLLWSLSFHSSGVSLILEPVCVFETVRIEWVVLEDQEFSMLNVFDLRLNRLLTSVF